MELVARRPVEGAPAVRADLGPDPLLAQQRERTARDGSARDVQVQPPLSAATQVQASRRMEQCRDLRQPIARSLRGYLCELLTDVLGGHQRSTPSSASSRRLTATPAEP